MHEYEFFLELFTEDDLRSYARKLGVTNWGNTPINKIPLPILKKQIKKAFEVGINKRRSPINVREQLNNIGTVTILQYGLPQLMGEELLIECASREDIPEHKLLAYLYVCDEELYNKKMIEWLEKGGKVDERLFEKYATEMTQDEYLLKMFKPERLLAGTVSKEIIKSIEDIEVPEHINIEEIVKLKTPSNKSGKMLQLFLKSEEGKKNPYYRDLVAGFATWALVKERDLVIENLQELKKQNKELEDRNIELDRIVSRLQEKHGKNNKIITTQLDIIKELKSKTQELTTFANETKKLKDEIVQERNLLVKENANLKKEQDDIFKLLKITPGVSLKKTVKTITEQAELLKSIMPNPDYIVIAADPKWYSDIPTFIPKDCIVSIDDCLHNLWCEKNQGKILYLHRQSFGSTKDFENSFNLCLEKYMNPVEINATDPVEWLGEIIRKEIR